MAHSIETAGASAPAPTVLRGYELTDVGRIALLMANLVRPFDPARSVAALQPATCPLCDGPLDGERIAHDACAQAAQRADEPDLGTPPA